MGPHPRLKGWLAGLAVLLSLTAVVPGSHAYVWTGNNYYNVYYSASSQFTYVQRVAPYLNTAFLSAYGVMGRLGWGGKMNIYFYFKAGAELGYTPVGSRSIYINTDYLRNATGASMGATITHETSHVLFSNYTNGITWCNRFTSMWYYYSFLTESLAYYTDGVAYPYGPRYTASTIKSNLKYYTSKTGYYLSWWGTGNYYAKWDSLNSDWRNEVHWQFRSQGYYLAGGYLTGYAPLKSTLYALRVYASYPGYYLRSSSFSTERAYFEKAFKYGYGYYANAGWIYTGSSLSGIKNTNYLYGRWWYWAYN